MQVGFHTIHFSPMFGGTVPVLDVIRLTAGAGFDAIGLDLASVAAHGRPGDVAIAVADAGLRCSDVLVLAAGGDGDLAAIARTLGALASAAGAAACITAVGAPVPQARLVAALRECATILSDHGCRLAVEFAPYSALTTLADATALAEAVGWERCGLVIDSLHFSRGGTPWGDLARLGAGDIAVVQWSDAPAAGPASLVEESRHGRLLPGEGGLALRRLAGAVRATGWDGVVSAEVLSERLRRSDPGTVIPAVHAAMRRVAAGWA